MRFRLFRFFFPACGLLAVALCVWWIGFHHAPETVNEIAGNDVRSSKVDPVKAASIGTPRQQVHAASVARGSNAATRAAANHMDARDIFVDESISLESRFGKLMSRANSGDANARHLARNMLENCEMTLVSTQETRIAEAWNHDVELALARAKEQCRPLASRLDYQALRDATKGHPRDATEDDIKAGIRKAFAKGGAEGAVSRSLDYYEMRPDRYTAQVIASLWYDLGITSYDGRFVLHGAGAVVPTMRADYFLTALTLLACDLGVPCGPNSDVVLGFCALYSTCSPGHDLYQLFRERIVSGSDMDNVEVILSELRRLLAQT